MIARERLRIAMQKSGRLTDPCLDLLNRCGLSFRQSRDKLFCFGEGEPVDLLLVRDDDIPGLIAQGVCDLGIVGRNVLDEYSAGSRESRRCASLRALGFGRCRLVDRGSAGTRLLTDLPTWKAGASRLHIRGLLRDWLQCHAVAAGVVTLAGSVEIAPSLGTADAICDLVQSGGTLVANQLREADAVLESEAVLAAAADPAGGRAPGDMLELLLRRLDGVIQRARVRACCCCRRRAIAWRPSSRLLPGAPCRPLLPMAGQPDQVMLQALCPAKWAGANWKRSSARARARCSCCRWRGCWHEAHRLEWLSDEAARIEALARPALSRSAALRTKVGEIIADVRDRGDAALRARAAEFDKATIRAIEVAEAEFERGQTRRWIPI